MGKKIKGKDSAIVIFLFLKMMKFIFLNLM